MKAPLTGVSPDPTSTSHHCRPDAAVLRSGHAAIAGPDRAAMALPVIIACLARSSMVGAFGCWIAIEVAALRAAWHGVVLVAPTNTDISIRMSIQKCTAARSMESDSLHIIRLDQKQRSLRRDNSFYEFSIKALRCLPRYTSVPQCS
jgi:hypothetical protein